MTNPKCILCHKSLKIIISKQVRDSKKHKVMKCSKCKHIQLYPIPSIAEDELFYDKNLQEKNVKYTGTIKEIKKKGISDLKRRVNFINGITPKNGKILEIGSGYGFFLEEMKKYNFDVTGIEISNDRLKIAKKITKSKILDVNIMENNLKIGKFHTIVLFHVLEHISNLDRFLKNIKNMLLKNGKIVIEVPNFDDYQIDINSAYKKWNLQRAHIHYFTPKTLKDVLNKNGLKNVKIIGVQRYGLGNMFNWKINSKPQLKDPMFNFNEKYEQIETNYKEFLQKKCISDTIISISTK